MNRINRHKVIANSHFIFFHCKLGLASSLRSQLAMEWGVALLSSFLEDPACIELQQEKTFKSLGCLALDFGSYLLLLEVPVLLSLVLF